MIAPTVISAVVNLPIKDINICVFIQVAEAKTQAEEAKGKAKAALDKAATTKNKVERSNNDLRDLIKQIRDFLTRNLQKIYLFITETLLNIDVT